MTYWMVQKEIKEKRGNLSDSLYFLYMKSLVESIFDKDLVQQDLSIEQIANRIFDFKLLKNIDNETRISWLDDLYGCSKSYSIQKLKNLNIDISEVPIIVRLGDPKDPIQDPYKIFFLFKPDPSRNYVYDFHILLAEYKGSPWSIGVNQYWNQLQGYKKTTSNLISKMERNYFEKFSWGIIENESLVVKIANGLRSIYNKEKS